MLDGPNLYFARPAIKVILHCPATSTLKRTEAEALAPPARHALGPPGAPGTALRQRFVMRRHPHRDPPVGAEIGAGRLGVRVRAGQTVDDVVRRLPVGAPHARPVARGAARRRPRRPARPVAPRRRGHRGGGRRDHRRARRARPQRAHAPRPRRVRHRHQRQDDDDPAHGPHVHDRRAHDGWSSTDGVVVMGETKEEGDFSGPAGARGVLETPGLEIGILETARGGMLLKGMGVTANDVSVVTNVSADHLGLQGIDTLDQLAEVKAIVTTVTKPAGLGRAQR